MLTLGEICRREYESSLDEAGPFAANHWERAAAAVVAVAKARGNGDPRFQTAEGSGVSIEEAVAYRNAHPTCEVFWPVFYMSDDIDRFLDSVTWRPFYESQCIYVKLQCGAYCRVVTTRL